MNFKYAYGPYGMVDHACVHIHAMHMPCMLACMPCLQSCTCHLPCRNAHEQDKFMRDAVSGAVTAVTRAPLRYVTRYGVTLRATLPGDPDTSPLHVLSSVTK